MIKVLLAYTYPISFHKVQAHVNIKGNEEADKLAKNGRDEENYKDARHPYEHAYTTPYYFQRNTWPSMGDPQIKASLLPK